MLGFSSTLLRCISWGKKKHYLNYLKVSPKEIPRRTFSRARHTSLTQHEEKVVHHHPVIFFFGPPGSGKSTFWQNHMSGYLRINHDTIKTVDKGLKMIDEELRQANPRGIVIDNTNQTKQQRAAYLKKAIDNKYKPIAFIFDIDKEISMFLNAARYV